ncbi:hypothetical protein HK405_015950, partial [Cladochytrium tenue]
MPTGDSRPPGSTTVAIDAARLSPRFPPLEKLLVRRGADEDGGDRPAECPPCFDCHFPVFPCVHFSECSDLNGKCVCPVGFGGDDCSTPLCDSLAAGSSRHRKPADTDYCECDAGWMGNNCNVCTADRVCDSLIIGGQNATCHTGTLVVNQNFMQCQVT